MMTALHNETKETLVQNLLKLMTEQTPFLPLAQTKQKYQFCMNVHYLFLVT